MAGFSCRSITDFTRHHNSLEVDLVMAQQSSYCPECDRMVLATREDPNHVLHLLISVFLCGLWLPVWMLIAWNQSQYAFQCPRCGSVTETEE